MKEPKTDKIALVTGGTRGIGRAISLRLASDGVAKVIVNYVQDDKSAQITAKQLQELGVESMLIKANLVNSQEIQDMFDKIRVECGQLDIFVHSAAMGSFKPLTKIKPNQWDISMNINARSFLCCVQRCIPLMSTGVIVAVSSLGARKAVPNYGAIGPSKAALEAIVRQLAMELAPQKIRINAVSGGFVRTDSLTLFPDYEEIVNTSVRKTPAGRLGQPEDIANAVSLLVDTDASWIYGQTIIADGGLSLL